MKFLLLEDGKLLGMADGPFTDLKSNQKMIQTSKTVDGPISKWDYDVDTDTFTENTAYKFRLKRIERDELLSNSDYTQFTDSTHKGTKEEWKIYRQKLRDITKGVTDPDTIKFPEEPK